VQKIIYQASCLRRNKFSISVAKVRYTLLALAKLQKLVLLPKPESKIPQSRKSSLHSAGISKTTQTRFAT